MASKEGPGSSEEMELEEALCQGELLASELEQEAESAESMKPKKPKKRHSAPDVHWKIRDSKGNIIVQRSPGQQTKEASTSSSVDVDDSLQQETASLLQELQNLLAVAEFEENPHDPEATPSVDWRLRQAQTLERDGLPSQFHFTRLLPMELPENICACAASVITVTSGKQVILIGMNGRYNLILPTLNCTTFGQTNEHGFFDGVFLSKNDDVSTFVDYVHKKTKHTPGKGICGTSQWAAAKKFSRRSTSKVDEEGLEVAVCRSNGEEEISMVQALQLERKLSSINSYNWESEEGSKGLQRTIEGLYLSIKQRTTQLYRQTDSNKRRHRIRRKVWEEKKGLSAAIADYNDLVAEDSEKLPPADVLFQNENHVWPWECHGTGSVDLYTKKRVFDKVMLLQRLREEKGILVREVKQHWGYLQNATTALQELSMQVSDDLKSHSRPLKLSEGGLQGLLCVLRSRIHELGFHQDAIRSTYVRALGQDASLLQDSLEEEDALSSTDDSTDDGEEKLSI
ncbi:hypothetical protein SKAU_G00136740 [Synaphobranchus kaupii]|uniref:Uncharacterized protein n=1 Tax=Synaphobranchus kaupii TaxID=118154 RepID=A0A9Q1FRN4_SYNKA|nr:hypothetical protein SKAU_G00136740 [Synaphobranchus kaupii]